MALLRPSLTLVIDLDERQASEDTILELKRSYAHITSPVIRTHAPTSEEEAVRNIARLMVKMGTYTYLDAHDSEANARWHDIVEPWIGNILHNVGNNMKVFNDRQRKIGLPQIIFERASIELENGALAINLHPDPISFIDPSLHEQVGLARTLTNSVALKDAVRIDIPSDESYEGQRAQAWKTWVIDHPQLQDLESKKASINAGNSASEKTREQLLEEDIAAKSYENTAVPPTDSNALPPIPHEDRKEPEQFDFPVDYSHWQITFSNGRTAPFDASAFDIGTSGIA